MSKIERRRRVVSLFQGNYEADLAELIDRIAVEQRVEAAEKEAQNGRPVRAGQKPKPLQSVALARRYDEMMTEAEQTAEKVTVWALGYSEWDQLADDHPAREDVPADKEAGTPAKSFDEDKQRGVNAKTFPPQLLRAALVEPDAATSLDDRLARGDKILAELDLSRIHYVKLETAAWNVNVGDDALPKYSLVSVLTQESDDDSKQQNDSE